MLPHPRERAVLVGVEVRSRVSRRAAGGAELPDVNAEDSMEELAVLADSAGATVVERTIQNRDAVDAATLVGSGKADELARQVKALLADLVVVDHELSPTQQRNL